MIRSKKLKGGGRSYGVRVHRGGGRYEWVGTRSTLKEARALEREALSSPASSKLTVEQLVELYLADYERTRRPSTVERARYGFEVFMAAGFRDALVDQVTRADAERFVRDKEWAMQVVVTLFNYAERHGYVQRSPFRGLSRKHSTGRRDLDPLTIEDVDRLEAIAREVHGDYGPLFGALFKAGAYTGLRPGELFGLEWRDIDFDQGRVRVRRAVSGGRLGQPKTGSRTSALLPEARDALLALPRTADVVFPAKRGGRLSGPAVSSHYLPPVCAVFGRKVTLHELRHFCGHHLYVRMDLPARVVATQLGHSTPRLVEELYGHFKVGALEEIDRATGATVRTLKAVGE